MTRIAEGTVLILDCQDCRRTSPHLIFSGDSDMATLALASLTSVADDEIVILEAEQSEWSDETGRSLEARANRLLSRDDLRFVRLLHAEEIAPSAGQSFQEFRKAYRAPNPHIFLPEMRRWRSYCGSLGLAFGIPAPGRIAHCGRGA